MTRIPDVEAIADSESVIRELHRVRREISDRFHGDIDAIAQDAARRLAESGRPVWVRRNQEDRPAQSAKPAVG